MKKSLDAEKITSRLSAKNDTEKVVSRILSENVLTLTEAQDEIEKVTGKRPDKSTICRWVKRGIVTGNGRTKLDGCRIGGHTILTSIEALNRFFVARSESLVNA